jgi:ABC-type transport system involved in cytochrome c biogenesis ATPase subunit
MIAQAVRCQTFIARRGELAVLEDARKALAQSSGSMVLVAGEAGIGKTRLLGGISGKAIIAATQAFATMLCVLRLF